MRTRQGATSTPPTFSGLDGFIRFVPTVGAPNSSKIVMIQIVKLTNLGGADENPGFDARLARGSRSPGPTWCADPGRWRRVGWRAGSSPTSTTGANPTATPAAAGSALSPQLSTSSPPVPVSQASRGSTPTPAGGTGGVVGQTPGFKRSDDAADIRSAALFDAPGSVGPANLIFEFECVAKGEDTQVVYGTVRWGFTLRDGVVERRAHHAVARGPRRPSSRRSSDTATSTCRAGHVLLPLRGVPRSRPSSQPRSTSSSRT